VATRRGRRRLDWKWSGREDRRTHASDQVCFSSNGQLKASSYGHSCGDATMVAPGLFRWQVCFCGGCRVIAPFVRVVGFVFLIRFCCTLLLHAPQNSCWWLSNNPAGLRLVTNMIINFFF
jgi:hypothetical protein